MEIEGKGKFFSPKLIKEIRNKFFYVDSDPYFGKRIYFENAGGTFTLKSVVKLTSEATALTDSHYRHTIVAKHLEEMVSQGKEDIKLLLGVKSGKVVSSETTSRVIFLIVGSIIENTPGSNVVTTFLEHPSNHDACAFYSKKTGKEFRVAKTNPINGSVEPEEILSKIDKNTCLLSFIASSNITGKNLEIKKIIYEARKINPDLFIFIDAAQYVNHSSIDVEELEVDGVAFTPYKMYAKRGIGFGWVSERVSVLPHEKYLEAPIDDWTCGCVEPASFGSFSAVIDHICWIGKHFNNSSDRRTLILSGMKAIGLHERALLERALDGTGEIKGLREISGVKVHFLPENEDLSTRSSLFSITLEGKSISDTLQYYIENGIFVADRVRTRPYSRKTLDGLGVEGVIRITLCHCNTKEEIDKFLTLTSLF